MLCFQNFISLLSIHTILIVSLHKNYFNNAPYWRYVRKSHFSLQNKKMIIMTYL